MQILHADAALIVVDKPAGLPVLPDGWEPNSEYLTRQVEAAHGKVWVVHRLDKVTSGVLVLARTAEAHRALSIEFERHRAGKIYRAIANGAPRWEEHTAKARLRSNVGHSHRTVIDPRDGKPSITGFEVLERFAQHVLLEARPKTGRTHQIRAHAQGLGCPLLADTLYGAPATEIIPRPALHAWSLTFTHPETGLRVTFSAAYPEDFERALSFLRAARS